MGEGPLLGKQLGGKPGDLPTARLTKQKRRQERMDGILNAAARLRAAAQGESFQILLCVLLLIYPPATLRNGIRKVTN